MSEGYFFQFTASTWLEGEQCQPEMKGVENITNNSFPFLDMELSWFGNDLDFKAYSKAVQKIKYPDQASMHHESTRKAVPAGVFKRLARLTKVTERYAAWSIQSLYPDHYAVLENLD